MQNGNAKPRLGVLALMLPDYEPIFPGITGRQTDYVNEIMASLAGVADLTFLGPAQSREETERQTRLFNSEGMDGILLLLLSYAQGQYLIRAMQSNRLPLALVLVQPDETAGARFAELDLTVNQGIHGAQDNANALMRAGLPYVVYAGTRHGGALPAFVGNFALAAKTVCAMRRMKLGAIGRLPGMGDVVTDDMAFYRKLGPEFVYDSVGTVYRWTQQVTPAEVDAVFERDRRLFELDARLGDEQYREALRTYLGLKKYLESAGYSGYTLQFSELGEDGRFGQLPLLAASHLMADGYGYAAEGDASCAALVAAMALLCGQADFSEMYMMDLARDAILFCHAGEGNWAMARSDKKVRIIDKVFLEGGLGNPPTPLFTLQPGPATVLSLVHKGAERFALVAAEGELLDQDHLENCEMPYFFFRPDTGAERCVTAWLEAGGTHHEAIVFGRHTQRLRLLARLLDIDLLFV